MHTLSVTATIAAHTLAWALLHSLWQGLLIFLALFILLKIKPRINAKAKYALSFGALATQALWFIGTWITEYRSGISSAHYTVSSGSNVIISAAQPITPAELPAAVTGTFMPAIEHYFPVLLIIYSLGLTAMLSRFLVNIIQVRNLRSNGVIPIAPRYLDLLKACQVKVGLPSSVQLFLSNRISVPMMLGTLKPVILLPLATINHLTTDQVEAILLHELAHIKRHDYLLNIIQTTIETILFFNPFIWLTSAIIRREREHCCDDIVVACTPSPLPYAKALTILEDIRLNNNSLAMAATGRSNHLFHRIKRIIEMKNTSTTSGRVTIVTVAIIAIGFAVATFTFSPSFAQKKKTAVADTSTAKKVYHYKTVIVDKNGKKKVVEHASSTAIQEDIIGEDDSDNVDINISINDNNKKSDRVVTRVFVDSSGKKTVIKKHVSSPDDEELTININGKKLELEMEQVSRDIAAAVNEIKAVDWNGIIKELSNSLKELDKELSSPKLSNEIKAEINKAMKSAQQAMEGAEKAKAKAQREQKHAKTQQKLIIEQSTSGKQQHEEMDQATEERIAAATEEVDKLMKRLERDGLIDRSKPNGSVKIENGVLFINGKKQSAEVYEKYSDLMLKDDKRIIEW